MFKTQKVNASMLELDDRFKMGSLMYRVLFLAKGNGTVTIKAYCIYDQELIITLTVPFYTLMKIYNQK